jgi:TfoX/Sxy family transcriptional regulator of competence genes
MNDKGRYRLRMTRVGRRREEAMADVEKGYPHRFAEVVEAVAKEPGVTFGQPGARKTFGHSALKVNEKIFAMVSAKGDFVVKLPKQRVDELEAVGAGKRFKAVNGSPMKEWLAVGPSSSQDWAELAREALAFVRTVP